MRGESAARLGAVLEGAVQRMADASLREARLHAEYLMAEIAGCDRGGLYTRRDDTLTKSRIEKFEAMVQRRLNREPLQHILKSQPFHDVTIEVTPDVLIPRPETEALVEHALRQLPRGECRVADLGTGSGCIAIALAHARPSWRIDAIDRSEVALDIARRNAKKNGVADRIKWHLGDFSKPPAGWYGRFDAVISNPPYVRADDHKDLEPEVRDHEPYEALVSGPTGLEAFRVLSMIAHRSLKPSGRVLLEFGFGQDAAVARYFAEAGFGDIQIRPDLRGIPRVLDATRNGSAR
ncbi:MAG: peptide chain release factor N(5)-glutamine methyltransferase [Acidobacteriota bacterium]|nr:peptide chain release factor N(5)-glutamine methyltransferase [Acidobacteriota bacterium]